MIRAATLIADLIADHGYGFCCVAMIATNALLAGALAMGSLS